MRLHTACMTCVTEGGAADPMLYSADLREDGLYEFACRRGHKSVICLQEQKFEILPELAVNAIIDGYYREAVASFTAGMERFFEFYIRVVARARKITDDAFQSSWKPLSSLSERQLGAYVLTHLLGEGCAPPLLSNTKIEFRNSVIHKGKFPSRDEAVNYGNAVFEIVLPPLSALLKNHKEAVQAETVKHMRNVTEGAGRNGVIFGMMSIPTPISLSRSPEFMGSTVEESIARVNSMRETRKAISQT